MPDREIFWIKQGDTLPDLEAILLNPDGTRFDLTGALGVKFIMAKLGGTDKVNAAMTIVDALNGLVRYVWQTANTDVADDWLGEIQVTNAASKILTFPDDDYFIVRILKQLGS